MNVVYIKNKTWEVIHDKLSGINKALKLFQWFDEETGKKYYFIPGMGEREQEEKNTILKKLWTRFIIEKTTKGMLVSGIEDDTNKDDILWYFFGLMVTYGKREGKNMELASIKIQIPLSGQHLVHEEILDANINILQNNGIFLKADKLKNNNGMVYQISSNDYELLEIYAQWYEAVEKFEKISKREFTKEMKIKLIEFIETNPEIPQDGRVEVLKQLKEWTIKLLTK